MINYNVLIYLIKKYGIVEITDRTPIRGIIKRQVITWDDLTLVYFNYGKNEKVVRIYDWNDSFNKEYNSKSEDIDYEPL